MQVVKQWDSWVCMNEWLAFSKVLLFLAWVLDLINKTFSLLNLSLVIELVFVFGLFLVELCVLR